MNFRIKREYNYSDVYLVPRKCVVESRSECDTSVQFGPKKFDMPVVAANMKSVVNKETCKFFAKNNWYYVMHRFGIDLQSFVQEMKCANLFTSISIGVNKDTYDQLSDLITSGLNKHLDYATLDIAHAWSPKAERMCKWFKDHFPNTFLTVGNIATGEAISEMLRIKEIDAYKVGIGGGKTCITRLKTGFTRPMISTLIECCSDDITDKPIIADGGIQEHGDIAKAIACGATMVMAGSLFCGYDQSASEIIEIEGKKHSVYFGSASEYNKGTYNHVEGKKILLDYKGDMQKLLVELKQDLQSSISYAGGKNLNSLLSCDFVAIN